MSHCFKEILLISHFLFSLLLVNSSSTSIVVALMSLKVNNIVDFKNKNNKQVFCVLERKN